MSLSASDGAHGADDFLHSIQPQLNDLEAIRLKKLRSFARRRKFAIPIGFLLAPFLLALDYLVIPGFWHRYGWIPWCTVIGLGLIWMSVQWPKWQYGYAFKQQILPAIAGLFGDFTYDYRGEIPIDAMRPSKILPLHSGYDSEDYFIGTYKSVGIQFSEISLTVDSGKNRRSVFSGLAILLTSGVKAFHGHTIITKDRGGLGRWFKSQTSDLQRADLVDPEFEKRFDVFTNDQVEARYLVDPRIAENLKTLYDAYDGKNLSAAFYDKNVLILIESSEDHFEPASIHTPAMDTDSLLAMRSEIAQIMSIIDNLSLYDRGQARRARNA